MGEEWRARAEDLDAIAAARSSDPFAVLGPHQTAAGWVIRVFAPEAISVRALTRDGALIADLPRRKDDVFEALIPSAKERPSYRVEVTTTNGSYSYMDSYAFGPVLGPLDDYLAREGTHRQLYRRLGAQLIHHEGSAIAVREVARPDGWSCRVLVAEDGRAYLEYLVSVGPFKIDLAAVRPRSARLRGRRSANAPSA